MTLTRRIPGGEEGAREHATLTVLEGPDKGASLEVTGRVTIGGLEGSDLFLDDPTVSRKHAEISRTAEGFLLQDLGSTNGTFLNEVRVDRAYLRDGAFITVGKSVLQFKVRDASLKKSRVTPSGFGDMVAVSGSMQRAFTLLEGLAASDVTVLIEGETGTGKELAARALHERSPRAHRPFVIFDCSTVPVQLMESELFGAVKGAYTGASESRPGAVQEAEGGTLFLDEIGELPLNLQPKLLRLLDRREYKRLGAPGRSEADIRFVAATNRDLESLVRDERFRRDLFFRVSAAKVTLPPLRERPEDIPILIDHFLEGPGPGHGRRMVLGKDAARVLKRHSWPGNVRELKNVLQTAAALSGSDSIGIADLPSLSTDSQPYPGGSLADAEAQAVRDAVEKAGGNKRKAARLLGIAPSTLYAKMKKFGID